MDGRLFMETGKGLMNEAVYVLSGYESALMDNCQARLWTYCLGVIFILRLNISRKFLTSLKPHR